MDYLLDVFHLLPANPASPSVAPIGRERRESSPPKRFGKFELTDAVRPSVKTSVFPSQGFRYDKYFDEESKTEIPVIMAAASREKLFSVFLQLVRELGSVVDVVLETSHDHSVTGHCDLFREQIDMPVLSSVLMEFENLLLNDGCTGIAVLNPRVPQEVQFDEHKLLIMYGNPLESFERVLEQHGIRCSPSMHFITEAEHIHATSRQFKEQFEVLSHRLGTGEDRGNEQEA